MGVWKEKRGGGSTCNVVKFETADRRLAGNRSRQTHHIYFHMRCQPIDKILMTPNFQIQDQQDRGRVNVAPYGNSHIIIYTYYSLH